MTTHELAKQLLACPDKEVVIEGWCGTGGISVVQTDYDEDVYCLIQTPSGSPWDGSSTTLDTWEYFYTGDPVWMNKP
jgi:hypothetical protein